MADLKPCPFCGNTGYGVSVITEQEMAEMSDGEGSNGGWYVICSANAGGCGSNSGWAQTTEKATEKWNTRIGKIVEVKESVLVDVLVRLNKLEKGIHDGNI